MSKLSFHRSALGLLLLSWTTAALAQQSTNLPGGAGALRETHGDWVVSCSVQAVAGRDAKTCFLNQQRTDAQTRQRILGIELRPATAGVEGTLVLPFGLALARGASFQIDDAPAGAPIAFRTCLPVGCVVQIAFEARTVAALRNGTVLKVATVRDGGGDMPLSISLKGFAGALDRTIALLR